MLSKGSARPAPPRPTGTAGAAHRAELSGVRWQKCRGGDGRLSLGALRGQARGPPATLGDEAGGEW